MTELERALLALEVDFPDAPDVTARVRARIESRRRVPRRALVVAFAGLLLAIGVALAVPPARSAILDFFGIGGVEIRRVQTTPVFDRETNRELGVRVDLDDAAAAVDFTLLVPAEEDVEVLLDPGIPSVTFGWSHRRLLLTEFRGEATPYVRKSVGPGTRIREVLVTASTGYWLEGERHQVVFRKSNGDVIAARAAGNVLLWEQDGISLRLEGARSLAEALEIAGTLRPHAV